MNNKSRIEFVPRWPEIPPDEDEALRQTRLDIRASSEETWRLMRALHEDLADRLDALRGRL